MMSCSDNVFFKTSATRFRPVDGDACFCLSCGFPLTVLNKEEVPLGKLCWECSIMTSGNRALHSATGWLRGETSRQGEERKPWCWASVLLKFSSTFLLPSRDIYYSFKVIHILPNLLSLPPYVHKAYCFPYLSWDICSYITLKYDAVILLCCESTFKHHPCWYDTIFMIQFWN